MPNCFAFLATKPAAKITLGLEVFVQLVIAAITQAPSFSSNSWPLNFTLAAPINCASSTGSSGFVGKGVCAQLRAEGYEVVGLSRRPEHPDDVFFDLNAADGYAEIEWAKVSHVIHLAAQGVKADGREWSKSVETNIIGATKLLNALCQGGFTGRLITTQTFYEKLVGSAPQLKQNPYIETKLAGSGLFDLVSGLSDFELTAVVIYQCYGPGDNPENVLSYAARQFARNESAKFGPCLSERDWIYIEDVVQLFVELVKHPTEEKISEIHAGSGNLVSIKNVIEKLAKLGSVDSEKINFETALDRGDQELVACASDFLDNWVAKYNLDEEEVKQYFEITNVDLRKDGQMLSFEKDGYFDNFKFVQPQVGSNSFLKLMLVEKKNTGSFPSDLGGEVPIPGGAKVSFTPNTIVDENGQAYNGLVTVKAYWYNPEDPNVSKTMPGDLRGISEEKAISLIVNGYAKDVLNKLPMEFAVEAQKLLEISLEGSVG